MGQSNGTSKRSEKGLLTPDNCVVAVIDRQPQMLFGTSNFDRQATIRSRNEVVVNRRSDHIIAAISEKL